VRCGLEKDDGSKGKISIRNIKGFFMRTSDSKLRGLNALIEFEPKIKKLFIPG